VPPKIDLEKCTGCGTCVDTCPMGVLELKDDKAYVANPDECTECQACEAACPNNAISFD